MNSAKWFWFAIGYQTIFAYLVSMCVYQIGMLVTAGSFGVATVISLIVLVAFFYLLFRPYKESQRLEKEVRV